MECIAKDRIITHGRDCEKVEHGGVIGHLHGAEDDREFSVDGVLYCGRCHKYFAPVERRAV